MEATFNSIVKFIGDNIQYFAPLLSGALTSFAVKAIDILTPERIKGGWLLLIVSAFASLLVIALITITYPSVPYFIAYFIVNIIIALVVYHKVGKKLVRSFGSKISKIVDKVSDG